mgnify:FL=1
MKTVMVVVKEAPLSTFTNHTAISAETAVKALTFTSHIAIKAIVMAIDAHVPSN